MILFLVIMLMLGTVLMLTGSYLLSTPGEFPPLIGHLLLLPVAWLMLFQNFRAWRDARRRGWAISRKEFLLYWGPTMMRASKLDPEDLRNTPAFTGLSDLEILNRAELMLERNALSKLRDEKQKPPSKREE